jgi:hypothetical protein
MSKEDKIRKLLFKKKENFKIDNNVNSVDNQLIKKLKIKKSALLKSNFYSTIAPILFDKSVEVMGYLIAPKGDSEDVINDVYLSHNQTVTSSTCTADPVCEMDAFKKIQKKGFKIIGWWHSHGLKHVPTHSTEDDKNFKGFSYSVFPNNKVTIDNFVGVNNLNKSYNLNCFKENNQDYLLIKPNDDDDDFSFRLSIDKINSNIIPLLKDIKISKIEKSNPMKIAFAYSMVTNSRNMQPYLEVSYKSKHDKEINYVKDKEVTLEVIEDEKPQFEDYKRLVDDVSKRVYNMGKLPTKKIPDNELRTIVNYVEKKVNNFDMALIKPYEKEEEVNKNLEEIIIKDSEKKLKEKKKEQKKIYKKETPVENVKQLPAKLYNNHQENLNEEIPNSGVQTNETQNRTNIRKNSNLEEILDKYNNHRELTRKDICNQHNIKNYTLDKILRNAEDNGYTVNRRANKILDEDKNKIINIYNNTDIKVKNIKDELNRNKQENEPEKDFSISSIYRILHKYENNGHKIKWRTKKNSQETFWSNPFDYIGRKIKDCSNGTKNFIKRTTKKYWKSGLVGILSLAIGVGSWMYSNNKPNKKIYDITPNKKIEQVIEEQDIPKINFYQGNNQSTIDQEEISSYPSYAEENKSIKGNQNKNKSYVIQEEGNLWEIMEKETGNPALWEIVYASNERPAIIQNQKVRQQKIRDFGKKYNVKSLKNAGTDGSLKPYELRDQYKINNGTEIELNEAFSDDVANITPEMQKEFNQIFYKS